MGLQCFAGTVEFSQGAIEGLLFASEYALGGLFDLFAKLSDPLARLIRECAGGFVQSALEQLRSLLQLFTEAFALGLAVGFVEFLGEDRLARLGFGDGFLNIFEEFFERFALLLPILREGVTGLRVGFGSEDGVLAGLRLLVLGLRNRLVGCGAAWHALFQLLLPALERIGLFEQFPQILLQSRRGLLTKGFASFLHHLLSAGAGRERRGSLLLLERLGGLLQLLSGLLDLFSRFLHALLIGFAIHAIDEFVGILEQLLLAIAQAFQLLFEFLLFLLGFRLLQREVQFAQLLVKILLSTGEFIEPIHDLAHFALRGLIGRIRSALGFVSIWVILEFQLLDLLLSRPLSGRLRTARGLRLLGLIDFEFARAEFQETFVCGPLLLHRLAKGIRR